MARLAKHHASLKARTPVLEKSTAHPTRAAWSVPNKCLKSTACCLVPTTVLQVFHQISHPSKLRLKVISFESSCSQLTDPSQKFVQCDNPVDSLNLESEMLTNSGFRCQFPGNKKQKRLSNTRRKCRQVLCSTCTMFLPYLAGLGELDSTR